MTDPYSKINERLRDEHERKKAALSQVPAQCDCSVSVRAQLNKAMRGEAAFIGLCHRQGLRTQAEVDACRRVLIELCDRIEKKQNKILTNNEDNAGAQAPSEAR
jgi:hypothetical protein